jgi:hypothetical protein
VKAPRPIVLFAVAYGLLVLVTLGHGMIAVDSLRAEMPEYAAILGAAFAPIMLGFRFLLATWLGWLIVRRASNVAKWFVVVLIAAKLRSVADAWTGLQTGNVNSVLWTVGTLLGLFAVACLFAPASRFWFRTKGRSIEADAAVFE